jgi:ABC-type glycerol-3-phosphate transport system permease component
MVTKRFGQYLAHAGILATIVLLLLPLVWMLSTSFKRPADLFGAGLGLFPSRPILTNYLLAWTKYALPTWFLNSVVTAVGVTLGQLATSTLAAYGFTRFVFPGKRLCFVAVLGAMIVPFQVTMIPNYILVADLGLLNTWWAVILPNLHSAFGIFLLRQYFLGLPQELFDAANLDGAGPYQTFLRVVLPMSRAPLGALGIYLFLGAWNAYFWPLLVLTEPATRTLPIGLRSFLDAELGIEWGLLMAASTLASLPALVAFAVAQKQLISSFVMSGIKG